MSDQELIDSNYSQIEKSYREDNKFCPYCQKCKSIMRMAATEMGWMCCACGNTHVSEAKVKALKEKNQEEARKINNRET